VHAWIDSDNAPELECRIQTHFWERRINRANDRKEFFKVSLRELEAFANDQGLTVEFSLLAEAKEYRQTISELQSTHIPIWPIQATSNAKHALPEELFKWQS